MNGNKYMAPHGRRFSRHAHLQLPRLRALREHLAKVSIQAAPKRFASILQSEEDKQRKVLNANMVD